ncbi:MAG: protein-methionine-sulfoxide reductase catalytic subunit MsrP [bacterium]|nr:protein-methionine-sulfoxide reductase catalytic subunit MsrP [bacterium]
MAWIQKRQGWEIPEREATPEAAFLNRRQFLRAMGGVGAAGLLSGCGYDRSFTSFETPETAPPESSVIISPSSPVPPVDVRTLYPASQNPAFTLSRTLTTEKVAGSYNNFYEFTLGKTDAFYRAEKFMPEPWKVEVVGLVEKPVTFDLDDLIRRMPLEERLYRLRCVEAWAMAVPWTGFPMKAFLDLVKPLSSAKYVKMTTFLSPQVAPGQFNNPQWPWPYVEALTIEEAANELSLLVTGIYGKPLPKQHGAPIRLVVPWKYGFKSIKSIVQIEFTVDPPATFWNTLVPAEYGFTANVNPAIPHPRWSQATERMIGTDEILPTQIYNGYGPYVASLYG